MVGFLLWTPPCSHMNNMSFSYFLMAAHQNVTLKIDKMNIKYLFWIFFSLVYTTTTTTKKQAVIKFGVWRRCFSAFTRIFIARSQFGMLLFSWNDWMIWHLKFNNSLRNDWEMLLHRCAFFVVVVVVCVRCLMLCLWFVAKKLWRNLKSTLLPNSITNLPSICSMNNFWHVLYFWLQPFSLFHFAHFCVATLLAWHSGVVEHLWR